MRLWMCVLSALILCEDGKAKGAFTPPGHPLHINDGNLSDRDHMKQEAFQNQQVLLPLSGLCGLHCVAITAILSV